MTRWIIAEHCTTEATTWDVMRKGPDGKFYLAASCPYRADAEFFLGAAKWADSLGMSLLSLKVHGITFDAEGVPVPESKKRVTRVKPATKRRAK